MTEAVRRYWSVLDSQDVGWLVVGAFVAYVGYAVRSLAIVMLVQQRTGSYVLAGAAVAGTYVGGALMAPLRGRLLDRYGQTRVVAPLAALYFATMTALVAASLLEPVAILLVGLAILGGAAFPAVFASMRSIWATMFRGDPRLTPAYALESVVQDTAMVCGPLVAGVLVAFASAAVAVEMSAVLVLVGALVFAAAPSSRDWKSLSREAAGRLGAIGSAGLRTLVGVMFMVGAAFGVAQIGVPAFCVASDARALAGVLLALMAAASMLAGLLYGGRSHHPSPDRDLLMLLATLLFAATLLPLAHSVYVLALVLPVAGVAMGPVLVNVLALMDVVAPKGTMTEAFGWVASGYVGGAAVGAALAGTVAQTAGASWSLALGSGFAGMALAGAIVYRSTLRDRSSVESGVGSSLIPKDQGPAADAGA